MDQTRPLIKRLPRATCFQDQLVRDIVPCGTKEVQVGLILALREHGYECTRDTPAVLVASGWITESRRARPMSESSPRSRRAWRWPWTSTLLAR